MTTDMTRGVYARSEQGFGLVEIMIALALGVIIMLGVTEIATSNSSTRWELERSGRQIENAAYALREIESDLTNSGFWGELGAQEVGAVPPVCPDQIDATPADDEFRQMLAFPVQGGQAEFDCITVDTGDADKVTPKAGTDYLAIRRASSCALGDAGCAAAGSNFFLQVNACFLPSDPAAPLPGIAYFVDSDLANLSYTQRDCATLAPRYRMLNRIYYINDDDQLMRSELVGNQYEQAAIVDDVELVRFEYGMDRDGDGQVDAVNGYTNDPSINPDDPGGALVPEAWADVIMVRVTLVVRSEKPSAGFLDNKSYTIAGATYTVPAEFQSHRRQVYSRTVSLRNVAGRRG